MADKLTSIADLQSHLGAYGNMKELMRHVSVIARIDSFLEDLNTVEMPPIEVVFKLNTHRKSHIFHPSSIGSTTGKSLCGKYPVGCARLLYYDYLGSESKGAIEPRTRRIFDTGSAVHAQLQAYLSVIANLAGGYECFTPEAHFSPKNNEIADQYDIAGSTDGIYSITDPDQDIRFGLEIKTINDAGYQKTTSPHPEHLMQGTVYQKCLDLPVMIFLYYNKNDSSLAEFVHIYDERRWGAIVDKLEFVTEHAVKGEPPDREDGWHCMSCKYKGICKPPKRNRAAAGAAMFRTERRKGDGQV